MACRTAALRVSLHSGPATLCNARRLYRTDREVPGWGRLGEAAAPDSLRASSRDRAVGGIMWVSFAHLRPSGHIMPDHAGDRGAVSLSLGASRSPPYQAESDVPEGRWVG